MRDEHYWPAWDSDPVETGEQPVVGGARAVPERLGDDPIPPEPPDEYAGVPYEHDAHAPDPLGDPHDEALAGELLDNDDPARRPAPVGRFRKGLGKVFMAAGGVMAIFVLVYAADLMISAGDVPRGVTVAGIDVGGMTHNDAEAKLRAELEPRLVEPVQIRAGDVQADLAPTESGLGLDWPGTLEQAGTQPLSPITRITSFFTSREVGVVTKSAPDALSQAVAKLAGTQLNHPPTEGGIAFEAIPGSDGMVTASAVEPRQGQELADLDGAVQAVKDGWLKAPDIEVPMNVTPVKATSDGVHAALDQVVKPAVAKPVTVKGEGKDAVLKPNNIGGAFQFTALDGGALEVKVDQAKLRESLEPQLRETEKDGKDAEIVFAGEGPTVVPAEQSRKVDWAKTFQPYLDVIKKADGREIKVDYAVKDPEMTTDEANALGIKEVVGEFSSNGFAGEVATNVNAIATKVSGAVVKPGETFSLNERTGARTASQGFVEAPVYEDGTGERMMGGGVSQFTTTLFNAAYFAGLKDAGHTPHPFYLDRYPFARDAISMREDGSNVDLAFTNDSDTGIAIEATSTGSSVSVKIWGTKHVRVESSTGPRADVVPPPLTVAPPGCTPSAGAAGFRTSDTRVRYDLASGAQVGSETAEVTYEPKPRVVCGPVPQPTESDSEPPAVP